MREYLRRCKKYFVFSALLSCFINLLGLTFTFYMYSTYDLICTSFSKDTLSTITIMAVYAIFMFCLFLYVRHRLLSLIGLNLDRSLSDNSLNIMLKSASLPVANFYRRGIQDLQTIRDYFSNQGMTAIFDIPWSPFYLIIVFCIHKILGIATLIATLIIVVLSILQEKLCQDLIISANRIHFRNSLFEDSIYRNSEAVLSMSMVNPVISKWKKKDGEVVLRQGIASNRSSVIQALFKGLQILLPVAIFGLGAYFVIKREITPGFIIFASILESQTTRPFMELMHSYKQTIAAWEAYDRLSKAYYLWEKYNKKKKNTLQIPRPEGNIWVQNVYFGFQGKMILKNISFFLKKGEFLGIIGPTGAGKTTLSRILCGIWPASFGEVRLDGYNIFTWDRESLGRYIGYLPQEVILFPGTIAENISGFKEIDEKRLEDLSKELGLSFIKDLPSSFNTFIDKENTRLLSGGQKQKIGLARAFYHSPSILILDEPNSNLDEEAEELLIKYLLSLKKKVTCIIISHTPKILSIVDKILVLKDGMMVGFGEKDKILKKIISSETRQASHIAYA